jgi:demethylmenaquinone methyltransferase/2-methoxy-6-polyprenyl-1,4-benzoquinol methylase
MQAPLPSLPQYWSHADRRQQAVTALFDRSARHYDRVCGIMSFGSGRAYRRTALTRAGVQPGMGVLDVGTGTGLLAREAAHLVGATGRVVGVDPSYAMMVAGRVGQRTDVVQGLGERLPFRDNGFDFVTMGYALRHTGDLDQLFAEYARVLKRGGRVLLLEITKPESWWGALLAQNYFGRVVPVLARIGTGSADASQLMTFYWDTIAHCVAPQVILSSLRRAGFAAQRRLVAGIFSEYLGSRPR